MPYPDNMNHKDFDRAWGDAPAAEAAIEWIDTLPARISMILLDGAYKHDLNVTKAQTTEAMEIISEALGDLFHKDRCRKIEICGEPVYSMASLVSVPNKAMKDFSVRNSANAIAQEIEQENQRATGTI